MTTIATDGITIAADGQVHGGGERLRMNEAKVRVAHGRVYALAGTTAAMAPVMKWHADGADPEKAPKGLEWTVVVIEPDGSAFTYHHDCLYPNVLTMPAAIGSGERFALGAMHAGKSPREAVEIAATLDINTGGTITEINIREALAGTVVAMQPAANRRFHNTGGN